MTEPLEIHNEDTGEVLTVDYNPREYTFSKVAPWVEHHIQGMDAPAYQWTCGSPRQLNMELLFDAYEEEGDARNVRLQTDKLELFQMVDGDLHRPPILLIIWGDKLHFRCLLRSLSTRFTMFLPSGVPVRAVANCQFTEFTPPEDQLQKEVRHSPDHTKRRVVKQGDTLSWIAGKEYGNPAEWRIIADANGISDPMRLRVGQELLIPPLY